jgi:hypothetical protein
MGVQGLKPRKRTKEEQPMKIWLRFFVALLIVGLNIRLGAEEAKSSSLFPYFSLEKSLTSWERTYPGDDLPHEIISDVFVPYETVDLCPANTLAAGLEFRDKNFFASLALSAPWWKEGKTLHWAPGIDVAAGFTLKKITLHAGLFTLLRQTRNPFDYDRKRAMRSIAYAGIGSGFKTTVFSVDYGFQISRGEFPDFLNEFHPYYSYALHARAMYNGTSWFHPFLRASVEKMSIGGDPVFQAGVGLVIGPRAPRAAVPANLYASTVFIKKPNIYLYPVRPTRVNVTIAPNGKITTSIPLYKNGWEVTAHPDGAIENTPGYLFYEALISVDTPAKGWCVTSDGLPSFLGGVLRKYGFNENEIKDFLEYWPSHLPRSPYWAVYPLVGLDVERICRLRVNPAPDALLRLWFVFRPLDKEVLLKAPDIPVFERKGFVVTEWGGAIKE